MSFSLKTAQVIGHSNARNLTGEPAMRVYCVINRTTGKQAGKNTLGKLNLNGAARTITNMCGKAGVIIDTGAGGIYLAEYNPALEFFKGAKGVEFSEIGVASSGVYSQTLQHAFGYEPTQEKPSFLLKVGKLEESEGVRAYKLSLPAEGEEVEVDDDGDDDDAPVAPTTPAIDVNPADIAALDIADDMPAFPGTEPATPAVVVEDDMPL